MAVATDSGAGGPAAATVTGMGADLTVFAPVTVSRNLSVTACVPVLGGRVTVSLTDPVVHAPAVRPAAVLVAVNAQVVALVTVAESVTTPPEEPRVPVEAANPETVGGALVIFVPDVAPAERGTARPTQATTPTTVNRNSRPMPHPSHGHRQYLMTGRSFHAILVDAIGTGLWAGIVWSDRRRSEHTV